MGISGMSDGQRVVCLLSGGIDSLVCAELLRGRGDLAGCVFVDYGHPSQLVEGWKAFSYCGSRGVSLKVPHVRDIDLGDMGKEAGARVVPHRNLMLLALAANAARVLGGAALAIGANHADQRDYVDCRPAFLESAGAALGMPVLAPVLHMGKKQIVALAQSYGLAESDAWSCYTPGPEPCGVCPSCLEARKAWG